jgi:uncharacterized membrane protein
MAKNKVNKEFEEIDGIQVPKTTKLERESPSRTLAKTISWRIVASATTFIIFYLTAGGKVAIQIISAAIGIEVVAKMIIYYLHERAWAHIHWGRYWMKNRLVRAIKLYYIRKRRAKK